MSTYDATGESTLNDNSLIETLISRMGELEEKYKEKFDQKPLRNSLEDVIASVADEHPIEPMRLCAIFTDFAEAFLNKAFEYNQTLEQNIKLNDELRKANDLIRRLTDENEYHLNKIKYLAKQLEVYKDSWKGKLTECSVERQISDLVGDKDQQLDELRKKLADTEKEFTRYRLENDNKSMAQTPSKKYIGDDESKQFSDLKSSDPRKYKLPKSLNFDQLYNELASMDHKSLVEYCIDLKQKHLQKSKSKDKPRATSAMRNSQHCHNYKSLTQADKATEILEKKYKRIRTSANDIVNKNTVYQNDVAKAEKRIAAMENRFNSLVEDFQKYINQKEQELAEKDQSIAKKNDQIEQLKNQDFGYEEPFHPLNVDSEERNQAIKIYEEIMDDYKIPQERDEVMLDVIYKYIYDKKQPNVAYGIWEAADFTHCNNIEKSYKLMKALLQDCYIPIKRPDVESIDKNSFSFRETQLKESFEKEKKMIDKRCETLKSTLDKRDHEVLELKDIIRLKNQEYELLKQRLREHEMDTLSGKSRKSDMNYNSAPVNDGSESGSISKVRSQSQGRSQDQPIQPYGQHKKELDELQAKVYELQDENEYLKQKLNGQTRGRPTHADFERKRTIENDSPMMIGGMSHMNLNATDENDASVRHCKIDMSPIETRNRDTSAIDEGLLEVFDGTASNRHQRTSKRRLNFDDQDNVEKENVRTSIPELDNIRSNKDILYRSQSDHVDSLRHELQVKQDKIDELTQKLQFYLKSSKSNDYSSPRFMEPEYIRHERTRNQRLTAEKVFKEVVKMFDFTERLYESYIEKFSNCIDLKEKDRLVFEQMSQNESKQIENFNKDDEIQLLQVLNSLNRLTTKATTNLNNLNRLIQTTKEPQFETDSQIEKEKRLLHVKSDHQLFLIKDLTEEVTKILENAKATKNEFDRLYNSRSSQSLSDNREGSEFEQSNYSNNRNENRKLNKVHQMMGDMNSYISHLEHLFHELIDRSATIIDNSDLIEKNYIKLLKIANGKTDQKKKIDEMHALNEENLRIILKLRKELMCMKKAKQNVVPQLPLDRVESDHSRPQSVVNEIQREEMGRPYNYMSSSMRANKDADSFLSKKLQEAEKKIERYTELLNEKEKINQALENEVMRKDDALRKMYSTMENTTDRDYNDKQDLNRELQKQRKEFKTQIDQLNEQLELKCKECKELIEELNYKDKQIRDNSQQFGDDNDSHNFKDENNRLHRELMICKDEANKYKLRLSQVYREIESYKSSLHSYEKNCEKLKQLNHELNKTLEEERSLNAKGRNKVHDQMMRMSSKVDELEGYSLSMENTNRDYHRKSDYLLHKINELREYLAVNNMQSSRAHEAPGTVRSNLSDMFSSCAKNPLDGNHNEENIELMINEIKNKFDGLHKKISNYQNAINKLQGEKQKMYQSMNQFKYEKSPGFNTPATKAPTSSLKKTGTNFTNTRDTEKSEAMIEYLRAEISHLRDKNKALEKEFEAYKNQPVSMKSGNKELHDFMGEVSRPAKDLIYQLCSDPHLSESYFYKEDKRFEGMESKYCIDVVKIFELSTELIVDLRAVLGQKEQIIAELDRKLIDLKVKFNQQEQMKQKHDQSKSRELELNFEDLDKKCREFASNLKVLSAELEKEKVK